MVDSSPLTREPDSENMRRSYIRVIISWLLMLAGLFAFQQYFSS
jgi:hypothetical protein